MKHWILLGTLAAVVVASLSPVSLASKTYDRNTWYHQHPEDTKPFYYYHNINPEPRSEVGYTPMCYLSRNSYPGNYKVCLNESIYTCTGGRWVPTGRTCYD
ncbi:MAG: hypothetical protein KC474_08600 [Cyanobacteria bacterium HKST-UBA04]|nr:hypothetical protein [Cyanobacteria bacterium HKST-UBA04]